MSLMQGSSPEVISENIREMRNAGHPEDQAIAASYANAGKGRRSTAPKKAKKDPPKLRTIAPKVSGQKPIHFKEGGLHGSTGTAPGKKISASKHAEAKSGKLGPKAKKQEMFYENVLKH